jgi:hypothetical protein
MSSRAAALVRLLLRRLDRAACQDGEIEVALLVRDAARSRADEQHGVHLGQPGEEAECQLERLAVPGVRGATRT